MPSSSLDPLQPVPWTRMEELSKRLLLDVPSSFTDLHNYRVAIYCSTEDIPTLKNALLLTSRIEWRSLETTIYFTPFPEKLVSVVQECLFYHNYDLIGLTNDAHKELTSVVYKWKTPEKLNICNFGCSPEVELAPLGLESVELIESNWYKVPGAAAYISTLIKHNPSLGVYSRSTGELCAWLLLSDHCTITMLHVMDGHRRKGYAQLLCNALSEQLFSDGLIIGATIVESNTASLKLFEGLQYKCSSGAYFVALARPSGKPFDATKYQGPQVNLNNVHHTSAKIYEKPKIDGGAIF